jgi:DNA-binding beta-propeller fold protein YncE
MRNKCLVVLALALLLPVFSDVAVVRANQLRQRLMLPQNTPQFIYTFFGMPYGLVADGQGNVYVADNGNNRIQKFTSSGGYLGQWNLGISQFPYGMALDGAGNVYVTDVAMNNNSILKFNSSGRWIASYVPATGQFSFPRGVAVDGQGNIYVADTQSGRLLSFYSPGHAAPFLDLLLLQ